MCIKKTQEQGNLEAVKGKEKTGKFAYLKISVWQKITKSKEQ